ncbi:SDR family oxidoreductase [Cryobacterium sinapicolor]|uniref:SDR family oxidoreductase n=1 Tax=Cryobacterium sinapicolor TaxID=1259236 RepID=A0ABY2JC66_9MICO|nr:MULTISPECIES: SDR family oxidoreductase [Cryobacterium]TFC82418.1 SDR family oxidoreductase [Cryobacterium sp. TMT3-29-2]TFD01416.1 SDR family oxidoreductase [Cryobacterium sinapicolor]
MTVIAIFGATGRTGRRVLTRALAAGFDVRALVRDPAKLATTSPALTVIRGDVLDLSAVDQTVAGSDSVLSLFGQVKGSPPTLQAEGTQLIVDAMGRHDVKRIVTLSGGGLSAPLDRPGPSDRIIRFLLKTLSGHVLADAEQHLRVLKASRLEWTVVRGPRLTEKPGTVTYRVGWVGVDASTQISRDDLADFILTQVKDRTFIGQMPFISA